MRVFKGKLYVKKGYTIVEFMIVICISSILVSCLVHQLLFYKTVYNNDIKTNRQEFYVSEALMFIEYQIQNSKSVVIGENDIVLKYLDETIEKHIKMSSNKNIVISHIEKNSIKAVNNILTNVQDFRVTKKNAVIYISITAQDSKVYERCIGIRENM